MDIIELKVERIRKLQEASLRISKHEHMERSSIARENYRALKEQMAEIYQTLIPVEDKVRGDYPELNALFDELVEISVKEKE